jgi:IclR family KDG regulon transcriptional repressor
MARKPRSKALSGHKAPSRSAAADTDARYKVEAVSRAMLLLEAFRSGPDAMTVAELSVRTGLAPQSVEATLATLARRGLVQRPAAPEQGWRLGLAWLRLADVKRQQLDVRQVALPVMRRMRDTVNETASLSIRVGSSRVNIEYAECFHEVRRIVQSGFHVALHVGAGGRALMSGLDDEEIEAYLAPIAMPQAQKTRLMDGIEATRRDGYAIVEGEVAGDTAAISAPVHNHVGEVVAALSLSLPHERLTPQMQARCVREVIKGAADVSAALGWQPAHERSA